MIIIGELNLDDKSMLQLCHTEYGFEIHSYGDRNKWDVCSTHASYKEASSEFIKLATTVMEWHT